MLSKSIIAASVFVTLASAQATGSSSSVVVTSSASQVMPATATQGFNPGLVPATTRGQWCLAQLQTCPVICGGFASTNQCDSNLVTYNCICGNGTIPDVTAFQQTLPFYVCQENHAQCINAHPNDLQAQTACNQAEQCGTRNATAETESGSSASSSTTSASATSSGTASASASSDSASASASGSSDASTTTMATGAIAAVMMAFFSFLL